MNDVVKMISQLEAQKIAIERAIAALRAVAGTSKGPAVQAGETTPVRRGRKKRKFSAEGLQRIIDANKKRWAAKRAADAEAAAKAAGKGPGRKKIAK